jgi:hypothetical protein
VIMQSIFSVLMDRTCFPALIDIGPNQSPNIRHTEHPCLKGFQHFSAGGNMMPNLALSLSSNVQSHCCLVVVFSHSVEKDRRYQGVKLMVTLKKNHTRIYRTFTDRTHPLQRQVIALLLQFL